MKGVSNLWNPQELTQMVASCEKSMPQYVLLGLDRQLQNMDGALGGCERIISTPIPLSYTRHTTRCILIYLLGDYLRSPNLRLDFACVLSRQCCYFDRCEYARVEM